MLEGKRATVSHEIVPPQYITHENYVILLSIMKQTVELQIIVFKLVFNSVGSFKQVNAGEIMNELRKIISVSSGV